MNYQKHGEQARTYVEKVENALIERNLLSQYLFVDYIYIYIYIYI